MQTRALILLVALVALVAPACETSEPGPPASNRAEAPPSSNRDEITLYAVDPVDAQTAFAYGTNDADFVGSTVLKTDDGGAHWRAVMRTEKSELVGLDFADKSNGVALADGGALFVTKDGGETWSASSDPSIWTSRFQAPVPSVGASDSRGPVELYGVTFSGALDGWAFGVRDERVEPASSNTNAKTFATKSRPVVYRTTDGGKTWKETGAPASLPDLGLRRAAFVDSKTGVAVGGEVEDDPTGVVARTTDGGGTWSAVAVDAKQVPTDVTFADASRGWLVGATEDASGDPGPSQILTTADGGQTWQVQTRVPTSLRAVRFVDPQNGWAVGSRGMIFHTTDGGQTWSEQNEQEWKSGVVLEADDPAFPGDDAPTFYGLTLLAPGRGWAISDIGVYELQLK
jgi:photosystem II stability/assembly factor-like uncharacterized protein